MVVQCEPIDRCTTALKIGREYGEMVFTPSDNEQLSQQVTNDLFMRGNIIILYGHHKDIDQCIRDHLITREISIGDCVLTGSELVAAVMADAIIHPVPGAISGEQSALSDLLQDNMSSVPTYTYPVGYKG